MPIDVVPPLVNEGADAKFDAFSGVPEVNLAILVIVAPLSVAVNVVAAEPVACAVVKIIDPGVSEPRVSLAVPSVAL